MLGTAANCLRSALGCGDTGGGSQDWYQLVKLTMSEASLHGAETLNRRRAERRDDFYEPERQSSRHAGPGNEDEQ